MSKRFAVAVALLFCLTASGQTLPALPNTSIDTTYPQQTGSTISVPAGGSLQSAINNAIPGDTILLQAGATFTGSFTLPAKSGSGWIVIRSSAADSSLPGQGTRMTPSYGAALPKIVATNSAPAIQTAAGAHNYRLVGLEITVASGVSINYGLVTLGTDSQSSSAMPYAFVLDRVYIHGLSTGNLRRGVAMNSATTAVIDSWISDCHEAGADAQAIAGWNGAGPFKIVNNYLEGAGENMLIGGADPSIANLTPSDIEVRGNFFSKPVSWRGSSWTVKNLFELKNARRVLVDGNVFEHNWPAAQNGFSILFTVRNQDGSAPWSVVEDVTFTHNILRHASAAINILGTDDLHPSQQTKRILVANNLFDDINASTWGGNGRLLQVLDGTANVTINHNTAFHTGEIIAAAGPANSGFTYRNNLTPNNQYGIAGDNHYGDPAGTLATYFPGAVVRRNVIQGGNASRYPADNFFPATMSDVGFVDLAGGDYRLRTTSAYKNAGTDGRDVGADIDSIAAATAGAEGGMGTTPPPPSDTTAPSVAITSPANGATVSSAITVTANATDDTGVISVKFYVDGVLIGSEDTSAPYSTSWSTAAVTDGSHVLTAIARDAAGNTATSSAVTVTVSNVAPPAQSPYNGTPFSMPGRFEAEDFDHGGEGLAYHDVTAGNDGGVYRTAEDVDIISPYAGGYAVNGFQAGEWMEYSISVAQAGSFRVEALVSSMFTTSRFHIEIDGVDQTGGLSVPNTGAWTSFQWVGKDAVALGAGQHVLRITADAEYFNVDALRMTVMAPVQTPFSGTAAAVPGRIEAENFDKGGEGIAYHDATASNHGGLYRTNESVDIISPYAGGYVVNNFQTGEWLEYTIDVAQSGNYRVEALVSSTFTSSGFHFEIDGVAVTNKVAVTSTGAWTSFAWVGKRIALPAGHHVLRITSDAEYFNLDAIRFR
jgi:hypothetical protein